MRWKLARAPAKICFLEKGKLIDVQNGFVDTFNWMADVLDTLSKSSLYVATAGEYSSKTHKMKLKRISFQNLLKGQTTTTDQTVFEATPISEE